MKESVAKKEIQDMIMSILTRPKMYAESIEGLYMQIDVLIQLLIEKELESKLFERIENELRHEYFEPKLANTSFHTIVLFEMKEKTAEVAFNSAVSFLQKLNKEFFNQVSLLRDSKP